MTYLPFGELMAEQSNAEYVTPYKFNGKELDENTGMYDYGARYYDPSLSLWLGVDPLADDQQNIGWSPYNYTMNNPNNRIDPDGRNSEVVNGSDGTDDWILRNGNFEFDEDIKNSSDTFIKYGS